MLTRRDALNFGISLIANFINGLIFLLFGTAIGLIPAQGVGLVLHNKIPLAIAFVLIAWTVCLLLLAQEQPVSLTAFVTPRPLTFASFFAALLAIALLVAALLPTNGLVATTFTTILAVGIGILPVGLFQIVRMFRRTEPQGELAG